MSVEIRTWSLVVDAPSGGPIHVVGDLDRGEIAEVIELEPILDLLEATRPADGRSWKLAPDALVEAVERVRTDHALAQRLGESARARFMSLFRIEAQAAAYDDLYASVVAKRASARSSAR